MIEVLARFWKILEARMGKGVIDGDRCESFGDQPRQAFIEPHAHAADALGAQADRGAEDELATLGLEEIDRADVGAEAALDKVDDISQRLVRVVAVRDELADLLQS